MRTLATMTRKILVEKHRPAKLDKYVFQDEAMERKVRKWVQAGEIPNVMFTGPAGCGKSTLARILINELGVQDSDVKRVNASLQNGINFIREELEPWMRKRSFGKFKIVLLEEADRITTAGQLSLRDLTESFSDHVRFIMTANHPKKIHEALHSRFQHIEMGVVNYDGILDLVCSIIKEEGIDFDDDEVLLGHVDAYAPDIRKIINSIDEHTDENKQLHPVSLSAAAKGLDEWEAYFSTKKKFSVDDALVLTDGVDQSNYEAYYECMYNNLHKFADKANTLVLISTYLDRAMRCSNQRLHLDALIYNIGLDNE